MDTIDKEQIAKAFEHFLATGNLNSKTNLGLRQVSDTSTVNGSYDDSLVNSGQRLLHHCRTIEYSSIHLSLSFCSSWWCIHGNENYFRSKVTSRSVGISLCGAHAWWFPVWSIESSLYALSSDTRISDEHIDRSSDRSLTQLWYATSTIAGRRFLWCDPRRSNCWVRRALLEIIDRSSWFFPVDTSMIV